MSIVLLIVALIVLVALRIPIAIALLATSLGYIFLTGDGSLRTIAQQTIGGIDSFPLLAVPLFILVGNLVIATSVSERLYALADALLGRLRAGLGYINIGTSFMMAWMNGSAVADAAAVARVQVPEMTRRQYGAGFSLGLTGASALLGALLPPSIPAIIYAVTAGVSISALFAAGIVPGILVAAMLCTYVWAYGKVAERKGIDLRVVRRVPAMEKFKVFGKSGLALLTPVIIIGGILGGFFTPTEAAAIGVAYLIVLGLLYRRLDGSTTVRVIRETVSISASVMIVVASANLFGWALTRAGGARIIENFLGGVTDNPIVFLLIVNLALLIIGAFLEANAAILIFVPILHPLALEFGIDPFQFGMIVLTNLYIGLLTPPVGLLLYVLSSATNTPVRTTIKGVLPFLGILLFALLLLTFIPMISTGLPSLLFGG